eukprot:SAG31_NODE_457_length_15415_cov_4.380387_6_plen_92_part_00
MEWPTVLNLVCSSGLRTAARPGPAVTPRAAASPPPPPLTPHTKVDLQHLQDATTNVGACNDQLAMMARRSVSRNPAISTWRPANMDGRLLV